MFVIDSLNVLRLRSVVVLYIFKTKSVNNDHDSTDKDTLTLNKCL